jgi:endonuclease/exonuclease/phosphatase family metal-dependent hydrolase
MLVQFPAVGAFALAIALLLAPAAQYGPRAPAAPKAPTAPKAPSSQDGGSGKSKSSKSVRPAGFWYGTKKAPAKKKGAIRVAAYNVENLFDGVDDPALQGEYDDIKMVTKEGRLQALADAIERLDADILCVEEIESLECLTWFRDKYLKKLGYEHAYSEDVGYYRGVEQGCLSRFPIVSHKTYVAESLEDMVGKRDGEGWTTKKGESEDKFQRSPLRLDFDVDGYRLTLFSVHYKAGGKAFAYQREGEALQTIEFVKDILKEDPAANVAVLGDFNASPSDKTTKAFVEAGFRSAYDFRVTKKGNTKDLYTTHDSGRAIDFIMMSKGMADDAVDSSFFVLSVVHPASDYDWRKDPDKEKVPPGYASDHYPIAIDIMPKDGPAKGASKPGAGTAKDGGSPGAAGAKPAAAGEPKAPASGGEPGSGAEEPAGDEPEEAPPAGKAAGSGGFGGGGD